MRPPGSRQDYDLIVIGAGSGGIGAALAAARAGLDVLLVEQADRVGGTAVRAGVSIWEMGVGGTGIPFDIYRRLKQLPNAVGVTSIGRHCAWPGPKETVPYPGGESLLDPQRTYTDTLRRYGAGSMAQDEAFVREHWHGVPFEPDAYEEVALQLLAETGHGTILCDTTFAEVTLDAGRITVLTLTNGTHVSAGTYIDATGDVALAAACGVEITQGQEARAMYDEPDAPDEATDHMNGTTLIYHVTPGHEQATEPLPDGIPEECWWQEVFPVASITELPGGDLNVNMLPTMSGRETVEMGTGATGQESAYDECRRRVLAHWHHLQCTHPEFRGYWRSWIAPALGIREGPRIVGHYVLTEHDLLTGLSGQTHPDVIALADHAMDTHGATTGRAGCGELREPYGIPYRCLLPKAGPDNLIVACRGASFSSLAASSCRLSRTMLQLGQAAGTAAALAQELRLDPAQVPADLLRAHLVAQHVQLTHPMPPALQHYLHSSP